MAILFALQFFSVVFLVVMSVIWLVTNFKMAWTDRSSRSELGIWTNAAFGVLLLAVAVLLAALYGWIPAPA